MDLSNPTQIAALLQCGRIAQHHLHPGPLLDAIHRQDFLDTAASQQLSSLTLPSQQPPEQYSPPPTPPHEEGLCKLLVQPSLPAHRGGVQQTHLSSHPNGAQYDCQLCAYTLPAHPGLAILPACLSGSQQLQLIQAALTHYPEPPAYTNHTRQYGAITGIWRAAQQGGVLKLARKDQAVGCNATQQATDGTRPPPPQGAHSPQPMQQQQVRTQQHEQEQEPPLPPPLPLPHTALRRQTSISPQQPTQPPALAGCAAGLSPQPCPVPQHLACGRHSNSGSAMAASALCQCRSSSSHDSSSSSSSSNSGVNGRAADSAGVQPPLPCPPQAHVPTYSECWAAAGGAGGQVQGRPAPQVLRQLRWASLGPQVRSPGLDWAARAALRCYCQADTARGAAAWGSGRG
ncbi:hypothetical protein QJQ45_004049 [Haematococcus lacustris]|nr:hypothetical protein QJQ45_004049 [Haematococcus lacustris]